MKWFGISVAAAVFAVAVSIPPIYGQDSRGQSGERAAPQRPAESQQATRSDAQAFINEMTIVSLAEVQLGRMASERAGNADVKSFGQMMVKDHTQANDELKTVASQLKVQPPALVDQKHKELADKLSKLSGAEFDREYINAMVQGHMEVLGKLRARVDSGLSGARSGAAGDHAPEGRAHDKGGEQDSAAAQNQPGKGATTGRGHGDDALTQWTAKVMPTVQKHLDRAKELQQKVAK
jgi:putative membrane protein